MCLESICSADKSKISPIVILEAQQRIIDILLLFEENGEIVDGRKRYDGLFDQIFKGMEFEDTDETIE